MLESCTAQNLGKTRQYHLPYARIHVINIIVIIITYV